MIPGAGVVMLLGVLNCLASITEGPERYGCYKLLAGTEQAVEHG